MTTRICSLLGLSSIWLLVLPGCCLSSHPRAASLSGEQTSEHWIWSYDPLPVPTDEFAVLRLESQRLEGLKDAAELLIETEDWKSVHLLRPKGPRTFAPISELSIHLSHNTKNQQNYAVALVPPSCIILEGKKSDAETMIDIAEAVHAAGFNRVYFLTFSQGRVAEIYPDGLPSREAAEQRKRRILEAAKRFQTLPQPPQR